MKLFRSAALLLVVLASGIPAQAWMPFQPKDCKVALEMPATPTFSESRMGSLIGKVRIQAYNAKSQKCSYRFSVIDPPRLAALGLSASKALDAARDGLLKDKGAEQVSYDDRPLGEHAGKLLSYTLPGGLEGQAWFVVLGKRCVALDISGHHKDVLHESPHFFSSLHESP